MTLSQPDPFVLLSGGLVKNAPSVPVFDLDAMDTDFVDEDAWCEVASLRDRMQAFVDANPTEPWTDSLAYEIADCERWLARNAEYASEVS